MTDPTVSGSIDEGLPVKPITKQQAVPRKAVVEPEPASAAPTHYKLNFRTSRGLVRNDVSHGIAYEMARRWGDLLHVIPSTRWCTSEEIVQAVWNAEKRVPFQTLGRSRKQIEDGIADLVAARLLLTK